MAGISNGFRIGFDYASALLSSARRNLSSPREHADVVDGYIREECVVQRRLVGPVRGLSARAGLHVSPFGIIPKSGPPCRWRMIVGLSSPSNASVNDGISAILASVRYARIDDAVRFLLRFSSPLPLAKIDLKDAYRIIPVHPDDVPLLGMRWRGEVLMDSVLPFRLRSAPKISAVADALLWIMLQKGVSAAMHYLDNFLSFGSEAAGQCEQNLEIALATCEALGVPVAHHKTVPASFSLTFLGIEMDLRERVLRLPADKLLRLRALCAQSLARRVTTKRELLSLVGLLHHASTVIRPGRSFVRRLIDLSTSVRALDRPLRLNRCARDDILWWHAVAADWNGCSWLESLGLRAPSLVLRSDGRHVQLHLRKRWLWSLQQLCGAICSAMKPFGWIRITRPWCAPSRRAPAGTLLLCI